MKRRRKFIHFLSGFTKLLMFFMILPVAMFLLTIAVYLINPKALQEENAAFPISMEHKYNARMNLDTEITFRNGKQIDSTIIAHSIDAPPAILSGSHLLAIIYFVLVFMIMGIAFYILYHLSEIFSKLSKSIKKGTFFYGDISKHIKHIAFSFFGVAIINVLNKAFFYYSVESISMMNQTIDTSLEIGPGMFPYIITGLVILVFSEVFKEGLNLKQESDLTI